MEKSQGKRIETVDSYRVVQVSGKFEIIGPEGNALASFNIGDKVIDFRQNLRFFNDNDEEFASIAQNVVNNEILDLFSNIGIDIKAPTFRIDYFDDNQGELVTIGPNGLLIASKGLPKDESIDSVAQIVPKNVETTLNNSLTSTKDKTNPTLNISMKVEELALLDMNLEVKYFVNSVLQATFPTQAIKRDTMTMVNFSFTHVGTINDTDVISISLDGDRDFTVHSSALKMTD